MSYTTPSSAPDLWDSVGQPYEIAFKDIPAQQRSLKYLLSNLPPNSKVLDVGCGTGKPICQTLSDAGHDVTGIDISPVMLKTAREQVPKAKFVQASAFSYQPEEKMDCIVAYFSLIGHLTIPQIRSFFPLAHSWLRPGGILIFATVPIEAEMLVTTWMGREAPISGMSTEGYLKSVEEAGFEVIKWESEKFMPKGEEAGLCKREEVWEEEQLFIYARKTGA